MIRMGMHWVFMGVLGNALGIHGFAWECTGNSWICKETHGEFMDLHDSAQGIHGFAWERT